VTKDKIQAEHQMPADQMKLIAYGKVMEDDNKTLKEYSIKEGDFLVVMISKVCSANDESIRMPY
jgi:co-chaperonin GroES (HSP10)